MKYEILYPEIVSRHCVHKLHSEMFMVVSHLLLTIVSFQKYDRKIGRRESQAGVRHAVCTLGIIRLYSVYFIEPFKFKPVLPSGGRSFLKDQLPEGTTGLKGAT